MTDKPWEGRFAEKTDRLVEQFTSSIDFDRRLYAQDIEGSIAHCRMLAHSGILTTEEADRLVDGLNQVRTEIERGDFVYDHSREDIHMHIEARLFELVGKVAQKLHTARSRNDQVALDMRLYLRQQTEAVQHGLLQLRRALVSLAKANIDVVMPGYTHLQRAQPVLLAHHLLAYHQMLVRDGQRFADGLGRINVLPLGAAALAGTTYPIDRGHTADLLSFPEVAANSMDAVSDRDFVIEFLSAASICMMHLSRLSEEVVLWSSMEFAFIELPDAFATGSSIMPQKKNPDVAELVRGKTGRVYGSLVAALTMMKALPLAYNRDMQEDKQMLFDAVDTLLDSLAVYARMLPELKFVPKKMQAAASAGFLNATELADYLVAKGMPFRQAHGCAGKAVAHGVAHGKELHELTLAELTTFSPLIEADVYDCLQTQAAIDRRTSKGGTATDLVRQAIAEAEAELADADSTENQDKKP